MPLPISPPNRRSVRRAPRAACALLAAAIALLGAAVPARAANDASDIVIDVVDAATGAPVALARVLVQGEAGLIGYTDADGHARFESVATGSYRAMVIKRGFVRARSPLFDVSANRTSNVRVRLQRTSALEADRQHLGIELARARVARGGTRRRAALSRRLAARRDRRSARRHVGGRRPADRRQRRVADGDEHRRRAGRGRGRLADAGAASTRTCSAARA